MKYSWEKSEMTKEEILKYMKKNVTQMYNACIKIRKEYRCKDCPFSCYDGIGCSLNGHVVNWDEKINSLKKYGSCL